MKKLFLLFKEVIEHMLYGVVFGWCWSYSGDKSGYLTSWDLHEARQTIKKLTHWVLDVLSIQSRLTLCDPRDCSPPGSSVHGIIQARILEWVAIFFSRGSSWRREQTCVSCIGRWILYQWATWEVSLSLSLSLYIYMCVCVSIQFNYSVMSYSLQPHGLWHARLPCPTPTPRACSNSCSSSRWCHPTISSSVVPFSSSLHFRWPKYWSFSFSISPSNACSALISFRIDQFDLLAVQGTLLQHHTSKASIIQCSAFLMVQLSHPYLTTGKTIAFTIWIFVGYIIFKISVELPKNISVYS